MKYKLTDALSSLGHAALAACLFVVTYGPLKLLGVNTAQWIAIGFPLGLYYGREIIDQNRNLREEYEAGGMTSEEARAAAAHPKHLFFVGWHLDGVLDVVAPWVTCVALALIAALYI